MHSVLCRLPSLSLPPVTVVTCGEGMRTEARRLRSSFMTNSETCRDLFFCEHRMKAEKDRPFSGRKTSTETVKTHIGTSHFPACFFVRNMAASFSPLGGGKNFAPFLVLSFWCKRIVSGIQVFEVYLPTCIVEGCPSVHSANISGQWRLL